MVTGVDLGTVRRREVLEQMVVAFRVFARLGYDYGANGHVTMRDPEADGLYWINPLTVPFSLLRPEDLVLVDDAGTILAGDHPIRLGGFLVQHALHAARGDAVAVVHLHGPYTTAWASLGRMLDPINQDARALHGLQALYDEYPCGSVPLPEEGRRAAASLGSDKKVLVLRNHGFMTMGETLAEAAWYFVAAERVAQAHFLVASVGGPKQIAEDLLDEWAARTGPAARAADARTDFARYEQEVLAGGG